MTFYNAIIGSPSGASILIDARRKRGCLWRLRQGLTQPSS